MNTIKQAESNQKLIPKSVEPDKKKLPLPKSGIMILMGRGEYEHQCCKRIHVLVNHPSTNKKHETQHDVLGVHHEHTSM